MTFLKKWFHPGPTSRDGLTQTQRETIVDLLNYLSFVDRDISDSEEIVIDDVEHQLDWDPNSDFDYYVDKSIAVARKAIESKDEGFFLQQIQTKLDSKLSRTIAVSLCEKLIKADGRVTPEENATLLSIKRALS
jgi:uncharacterized tellurite resistance protein B-like protein